MACIAPGCEERWIRTGTLSGTSFFSLPASPERQNKWLQYAGVEKAPYENAAFLCSKHFSNKFLRKSIRGMTLRPNAIPDVPMNIECQTTTLEGKEDCDFLRDELENRKRKCHVARTEHFDISPSAVELSNEVPVKQPKWPLTVEVPVDNQNICGEKNQEDTLNNSILQNLKNNICRVCGRTRTSLLPIFGNHLVNEISIFQKIQMHLPLKIKTDDGLPPNICMSCNAMIQAWHDLHTSCIAADAVLCRMFIENTDVVSDDSYLENSDQRLTEGKRQEEEDVPLEMSSPMSTHMTEETVKTQCPEQLIKSNKEMVKETNVGNISLQFHSRKSQCVYCSEYFESLSLKQHKLQCQLRVAMCEFCGICVQIRYLKSHMHKVHKKTLLCEICGDFFSWYNLKQHREECALEATNYCEPCCRLFYSKEGYNSHMREHNKSATQHIGLKIKASFQEELSLIYHCPVCEDSFDNKLSVIVHLNSHKVTTCKPCNKDFRNERSFLAHVHIPQKQLWHCRHCFKVFGKHYSWQIHERTHGRNKPFTCKKCEKHYPSLESLLQHTLSHGSSLFECSYCEEKFNRQILLKEHFLYHEGFIYKCKLCRKQFRTSSSLKSHKLNVHRKMKTVSKLN